MPNLPDESAESLSTPPHSLTILSPEETKRAYLEGKITDRDLLPFMEMLALLTWDPDEDLNPVDPRSVQIHSQIRDAAGDIICFQPSAESLQRATEAQIKTLKKLILDGNTFVITVDGKMASMISINFFGKTEDGRDVYETCKAVTLPAFQQRHFYTTLHDLAVQEIYRRFPQAAIMSVTRNKFVRDKKLSAGFEPLTYDQVASIGRRNPMNEDFGTDDDIHKKGEKFYRCGWNWFLFDRRRDSGK